MYKKILSFIINENNELLLLRNNPIDPKHGGDYWYTVTGGFETNETDGKEVAKREIKEETNLNVKEIIYLNWVYKYINDGIECIEYAYVSFVENGDIILNEENIEYKWCNMETYIDNIRWYGNVNLLKEVLANAINKNIYFTSEIMEEY